MPLPTFKIIAPALTTAASGAATQSDAEYFGSATWLWMQSRNHCNLPLLALDDLLLPAIRLRQFAIVTEETDHGTRPVAYLGWANLNAAAESRYLRSPLHGLQNNEWNSGDRMWFTDFFAPCGNALFLYRLLQPLFCKASARYMDHRSNERGVRVHTFVGSQVDADYARTWWRDRPMLAFSPESGQKNSQDKHLNSTAVAQGKDHE
jgi:cytolysin-activating lysine-acyltransferase